MSESKKENQVFSTGLTKVTNTFAPMIEAQLTGNGVVMDGYSKQCVINAISAINAVLEQKEIKWNDDNLDKNNVTQTLLNVAALKLNAAASPREVYFQIRNVKFGNVWKKQIEMGIEGDGNDAILARFGRGVEKVGQVWLVREGDSFEYPKYTGFEVEPPKWSPTGQGEVIRVVYPIKKTDGTYEYHIAERVDVAKNLLAHINNNLMNETFGIAKSRYDAKPEQLKKINDKKQELLKKAKEMGLEALDNPDLHQWISPAWTEYQSREQMIIRKMRNNIAKKIPKDFGNAFIEMTYQENTDDSYKQVRRDINENANREVIDVEFTEVDEEKDTPASNPVEATANDDQKEESKPLEDKTASQPNMSEDFSDVSEQEQLEFANSGPGF